MAELVFIAEHGPHAPHSHHIGICQEGSAAGQRFNDKNFQVLLQRLENTDTLGSKIQFAGLLQLQLQSLLPKFINV